MSCLAKFSVGMGAKNLTLIRNVACYQHQQNRSKSFFEKYFGSAPRAPEGTNRECKVALMRTCDFLTLANVFKPRSFLSAYFCHLPLPSCPDG